MQLHKIGRKGQQRNDIYVELLQMGRKEISTMTSTTRMFKPLLRGAIIVFAFAAVGPAAAQPSGPPPRPTLPTTKEQCFNGGWQTFGVFKNQGDCVSFVASKEKNPPSK
ncbi:MAG: hypothetical protein HYS35_02350 [Betaproteobacteria bacterium]|nr:hypothetical protein [Betaproteobacteria bacterium]